MSSIALSVLWGLSVLAAPPPAKLTLLFTADNGGELAPCG
jgi:hypothetical protein